MNRVDELTALVAVVEHGSFSVAADRLGIAKSTVSRRVTDLETRLGVRLFNRTTRRLNLTEPGCALHERTVRILADWVAVCPLPESTHQTSISVIFDRSPKFS